MICHQHPRVDALLTGQLPPPEVHAVRTHLRGCEICRAHYDRFAPAIAQFEGQLGPIPQATAHHLRATLLRPARRWYPLRWAAAAALLIGGGWLALRPVPPAQPLARGGAEPVMQSVRVLCIDAQSAEPVVRGEAHDGEALRCAQPQYLQFTYSAERAGHLALFSVHNGALRWYQRDADANAITPGTDQPLPGSVHLRAHPIGPLRLQALFSAEPIDRAQVERALRDGSSLRHLGTLQHINLEVLRP
jgi:hypothetical protein